VTPETWSPGDRGLIAPAEDRADGDNLGIGVSDLGEDGAALGEAMQQVMVDG
jgi:hypothetical protein